MSADDKLAPSRKKWGSAVVSITALRKRLAAAIAPDDADPSMEFALREYERVGTAINRLQDARAVALAGALALIGTVVVAGVNDALATAPSETRSLRVSLLVAFGAITVIVSVVLTGYFVRGIHRLSTHLRDNVEPKMITHGLESNLSAKRGRALNGSNVQTWGASHTFSLIYGITVLFLAAVLVYGASWGQTSHMAIALPTLILAMCLSIDLGVRFSPLWAG